MGATRGVPPDLGGGGGAASGANVGDTPNLSNNPFVALSGAPEDLDLSSGGKIGAAAAVATAAPKKKVPRRM